MALVSDVYQVVCNRILEPGGLQLGVLTVDQFLLYFADVLTEFLRDTAISKVLVTQAINFSVGQYLIPERMLRVDNAFTSARFIPKTTADSLDNTSFQWRRKIGPVKVWHDDGLPMQTVELSPAPNWQGALYQTNSTPPAQYIDQTTPGAYFGVVNTFGAAVSWVSGPAFNYTDATWQGKTITITALDYTIQSVTDATNLIITASAGIQNGANYVITYPVAIPAADRNLTTYGPQTQSQLSFVLTDTIPLVPATAVIYLGWGILAKIYSDNSELKDAQKQQYSAARFTEGINLFRAALIEALGDSDTE